MGSLRDLEVACSTVESCAWRAGSPHSSHHSQEVILAPFNLYVHKGGLKPQLLLVTEAPHNIDCFDKEGIIKLKLLHQGPRPVALRNQYCIIVIDSSTGLVLKIIYLDGFVTISQKKIGVQ